MFSESASRYIEIYRDEIELDDSRDKLAEEPDLPVAGVEKR